MTHRVALASMSTALIVAVAPDSPADRAGVVVGDVIASVNGQPVRDVIEYRILTDGAEVSLTIDRGGLQFDVEVAKSDGEPLGIEVESAVFDRVRTCDNHCEFCFIYQLPKGMRRSLYLKDDDYRLSFLYGNFTTLTRFTEADLERVITENLSPLYVSIHATDPIVRNEMLRNPRGAMSLRWLRALLDHGIEVHGQIVVCPGLNDGDVLEDTLCGVLDEYPELADVALVPLGLSKFNKEPRMRLHTQAEAERVCDLVDEWQEIFRRHLGHRMVYAADEYYLIAGRPFPDPGTYDGFSMHEDGIGMARAFELEFDGTSDGVIGVQPGFFAWVDGAPAEGYRAPRNEPGLVVAESALPDVDPTESEAFDGIAAPPTAVATSADPQEVPPEVPAEVSAPVPVSTPVVLGGRRERQPIGILTGTYGVSVLGPLIEGLGRDDIRIIEVPSGFFGGNVGVAGLMVGEDLQSVLASQPEGHRYLLPDVCLSGGRFLDGLSPDDLPRQVEIIATDGVALRRALGPAPSVSTDADDREKAR